MLFVRFPALSSSVAALMNPPSLTLERRTLFRGFGLFSCNLSAETNNFGFGSVFLLCLDSELKISSAPGLELRTDFRGCGLCSCRRSFIVLSFHATEIIFIGTQTHDDFSELHLILWSPRRNKQLWSWRRSSTVLSFRATGTIFSGTRTQDSGRGLILSRHGAWWTEGNHEKPQSR
jgi:hypothetical protein